MALENLALRQQLAMLKGRSKRARPTHGDRFFWMIFCRYIDEWRAMLFVLHPDTVIRWHREGFRWYWTRKSRRVGRPGVDRELRKLIREMQASNVGWGAPRIRGELLKLGFEISQATVSKYMRRRTKPPYQSWRTFLNNHLQGMVAIDFFTVPTATFRILYVFLILRHDRRRILHVNVTAHPTSSWTAQQMIEAFPFVMAPSHVLRDRDSIYGKIFRSRIFGKGIKEVLIAPRCPWQNPYVEGVIGSVRRERLDHVIILNERHLRRLLSWYLNYYHGSRTHLSLAKDSPDVRSASAGQEIVVPLPKVGGLHHRYERITALWADPINRRDRYHGEVGR
ncbi:MAG: integrase core domain-containing protein [Geminicoccales bacterium]